MIPIARTMKYYYREDTTYLHVCASECFCPDCGEHKISGQSIPIYKGYKMFMECPRGHFRECISETHYSATKMSYVTSR